MRLRFALALVFVIGFVAACGGEAPDVDGEWVLTGLVQAGVEVPLLDGEPERLTIEAERIRGGTGCNSFSGSATFDGDEQAGTLVLDDVGVTEMACLEPARTDFERSFTDVLFAADRYALQNGTLTWSGQAGELVYERRVPPESSPLAGTVWTLDTIFSGSGPSGTASTPNNSLPPATFSVSAGGDGGLSTVTFTSEDCGEFSIPLVIEDPDAATGAISTPPNIRLAAPQCDDQASNLLAAHAGVLSADRWAIEENRLIFSAGDSPTVAFTAL